METSEPQTEPPSQVTTPDPLLPPMITDPCMTADSLLDSSTTVIIASPQDYIDETHKSTVPLAIESDEGPDVLACVKQGVEETNPDVVCYHNDSLHDSVHISRSSESSACEITNVSPLCCR